MSDKLNTKKAKKRKNTDLHIDDSEFHLKSKKKIKKPLKVPFEIEKLDIFHNINPRLIAIDKDYNISLNKAFSEDEKTFFKEFISKSEDPVNIVEIDQEYDEIIKKYEEKKNDINNICERFKDSIYKNNIVSSITSSVEINFILSYIIKSKKKISARNIMLEYNKEYPEKKIPLNTVLNLLKNHLQLKYSYGKKFKSYYFKKIFQEERFIFLKTFYNILKESFTVVFIDESSFGSRVKKHKKWIYKDSNLPFCKEEIKSFEPFEMILATTFEKIVYYEIIYGTNNHQSFKKFILNLLTSLNNEGFNRKNLYFYLDNSSIHHHDDVTEVFMINRCKVIYGVNNYSLYDYCEYIFQVLKHEHYENLSKGRNYLKNLLESGVNKLNLYTKKMNGLKRQYYDFINRDILELEQLGNKLRFIK